MLNGVNKPTNLKLETAVYTTRRTKSRDGLQAIYFTLFSLFSISLVSWTSQKKRQPGNRHSFLFPVAADYNDYRLVFTGPVST